MRKIAFTVITLVIAVLMALSGFIFYAWMVNVRTRNAATWINNSRTANNQARAIAVVDNMSSNDLKDYLLTNGRSPLREQHLQDSLQQVLHLLITNTHNNTYQQQKLQAIRELILEKRRFKEQVILAARTQPDKARELITGPELKSRTSALHRLLQDYILEEQAQFTHRMGKDTFFTKYSFWITLFISLLTITLLAAEARYIFRLLTQIRIWANDLQKSEQSFKRLAEEAEPIIFKSTMFGFFTYVSPRAEELTGYPNTAIIGKHYSLFLEENEFERLQVFYIQQLLNGDEYSSIQFEIITKTGEKKWVEQLAYVTTTDDGRREFECIVKDIDKEHRNEESMIYLQKRLEAIIDYMPSMMSVNDISGRFQLVNNRFMEIMQVEKEAIIGKTAAELNYPWVTRYTEMSRRVLSTGTREKREESLTINGKIYHFLLTMFPLRNDNNEMISICCIGQDLTEKVNYLQQEKDARNKAEDARKSQEMFLANMSHEIRTPMNGIVGMTQLLLQENTLLPQQQVYANAIKRSAANLLVIINEILDFSRIKAGKLQLESEPFNLPEVVKGAIFPLEILAKQKGLAFIVNIDDAVPAQLLGDQVRLTQVLINLVENAIKFTHHGMVTVSITLVTTDKDGSRIILGFEVKDTGIGIAEDKQAVIFESFSQSHNGNSREYGGTGLGLAICRDLITLQQGSLSVTSKINEGAVFYFELPFTKDPFPPQQQKTATNQGNKSPLKGKTILVVEDNKINQQVAFFALRNGGASVDIADSGAAALEILTVKVYNCIIMDIQMPGMDGYETTRAIRNHGINTPVIAVTASALEGERERCLEAGMNDYISKPFQKEDLFSKIQAAASSDPVRWPSPETAPGAAHDLLPQEPHQPGGTPSSPPPVSFEFIHQVVADNSEVKTILTQLLDTMPEYFDRLQECIVEKNWEEAGTLAHQLKGNLGFVCMHEAVQLAHEIGRNIVFDCNPAEISRKANRIKELFFLHKPAIEAHIETCL